MPIMESLMSYPKPPFQTTWQKFIEIYDDGSLAAVGKKIGGKVEENIELGFADPKAGFTNACAIRMSYCLNHAGLRVTRGVWKTVSGKDGKQYIYRVADLIRFLKHAFGDPDKTVRSPKMDDFAGMQGILVFGVEWMDATGHVTLWNGRACSDRCHFPIAREASIWLLD